LVSSGVEELLEHTVVGTLVDALLDSDEAPCSIVAELQRVVAGARDVLVAGVTGGVVAAVGGCAVAA
jgi:hypothetical protein